MILDIVMNILGYQGRFLNESIHMGLVGRGGGIDVHSRDVVLASSVMCLLTR